MRRTTDPIPRGVNNWTSSARRDAMIALVVFIAGVLVLMSVDFFEAMFALTRDYEHWELDELISAVLAAVFSIAWFAFRRWQEVRDLNFRLHAAMGELNTADEERRAAERQLHETQKLAAVGHLAGGLAHELNNVLQPILTLSELSSEQSDLSEGTRRRNEKIIAAANRGREITRKVLTFAGSADKETGPVVFAEALQECIGLLKEIMHSSVNIHTDLVNDAGLAAINITELSQVMTNLVSNAGGAMEYRGDVTITSAINEVVGQEAVKLGLNEGRYFSVSVSDTGSGMTEDVRIRAFDPFFSTKKPGIGTGLGLSVVFGIIDNWGGHISLNSQPEKGTTVLFHVPVLDSR